MKLMTISLKMDETAIGNVFQLLKKTATIAPYDVGLLNATTVATK